MMAKEANEEVPDIAVINWIRLNFVMGVSQAIPHAVVSEYFTTYCSACKYRVCTSTHIGALIRQVFPDLRVGWVGEAYCFFGLEVQPESLFRVPLSKLGYPISLNLSGASRVNVRDSNGLAQHPLFPSCDRFTKMPEMVMEDKQKFHPVFDYPEITGDIGRSLADVDEVLRTYREHLNEAYSAVITSDFSEVDAIWTDYWDHPPDGMDRDAILSNALVLDILTMWESEFCESLVQALFPHVCGPIHPTLLKNTREFIRCAPKAMMRVMQSVVPEVGVMKLNQLDKFVICLQKRLSVDNLCQALRAVLQDEEIVDQMAFDWARIDFNETAAHAKHIYETKGLDLTSAIQFGLKDLLNDLPFLEDYLSWLTKLINKTLVPRTGPLSIDEANLVLVQWSFLFSAIIRDLTLRSASSFGHFHLVRLLMDEYVAYSIDTYKRTQQSIEIANKVWGMQ